MRATLPSGRWPRLRSGEADEQCSGGRALALARKESLFADWKLWFTHCGQKYLLGQVEKSYVFSSSLSAVCFIGRGHLRVGYSAGAGRFVCRAFDTLKLSLGEKRH